MARRIVKIAKEWNEQYAARLGSEIRRVFRAKGGRREVGHCALAGLGTGYAGAVVGKVFADLMEEDHLGVERRCWTVTLVENAGCMRSIHGQGRWGFLFEVVERDYCHCHPSYPEFKCSHCHSQTA